MDANTLAKKMIEWGERKAELDALEEEIAAAVLEVGKTQTVGNVRATYSSGRGKYDYERAAADYSLDLEPYTKITYDYTKAVKDAGIDTGPYYQLQSGPSINLKVIS